MKKLFLIIFAIVLTLSTTSVANAQITREQYYARSNLNGVEVEYYDDLHEAINNGRGLQGSDYGISDNRAYQIAVYAYNDSPELYNWSGLYTKDQLGEIEGKFKQKTDEILNLLNANMTEYEKLKTVYIWLGKNIYYDYDSAYAIVGGESSRATIESNTIVGGLINGEAVCGGIASALQYVLYKIDIPCYVVTGTLQGGSHAWNMIRIDGQWYYSDLTKDIDRIKTDNLLRFLYDDSLLKDHIPNEDENPPLPACTSKKYMEDSQITPEPTATPTSTHTPTPEPTAIAATVTEDAPPPEIPEEAAEPKANYSWLAICAAAAVIITLAARRKRKA